MIILDGRTLSEKIISSLSIPPNISLHVILVGNDPSSVKYVSLKQKKCEEIGINFTLHHLSETATETELLSLINSLNSDPFVSGFFIQLPLPKNIDQSKIIKSIDPKKDIDGLNPDSKFTPAVVTGIIKLLENYQIDFAGKNIVVVNDSNLIGQPLKKVLESKGGIVTLCNENTSNLQLVTEDADILISAVGVKNIITNDFVKDGAVVIDVGGGDIDFADVCQKCSYITPTFGGVGPMTIACLLYNLINRNENPAF